MIYLIAFIRGCDVTTLCKCPLVITVFFPTPFTVHVIMLVPFPSKDNLSHLTGTNVVNISKIYPVLMPNNAMNERDELSSSGCLM